MVADPLDLLLRMLRRRGRKRKRKKEKENMTSIM
jgi:hypothetical protein